MIGKIAVFLALGVLLVGCASPSTQAAAEWTVEASDFSYSPSTIIVPAGQPVTLTLRNTGAVEHDFAVDSIEVTDVEASQSGPAAHHQTGHAAEHDLHFFAGPGETETLQFTALEPGTYEILCSVDGHREAGMIGRLIVTAQE